MTERTCQIKMKVVHVLPGSAERMGQGVIESFRHKDLFGYRTAKKIGVRFEKTGFQWMNPHDLRKVT